jgi:hypothetical protein
MAEEKKKKPAFKVERTWAIDINDDVCVEPSAIDFDSLTFTAKGGDDDGEEMFTVSFEEFEALYFAVKAERERIAAFEQLEKPKKEA